jgi:adenosylmethionine---8-amino-7-oxononanoate aminotransferase
MKDDALGNRDYKSLLRNKDHQFIWHPFTQMKDWLEEEPIIIESAEGAVLRDTEGREYLDANSSIWTNLHGHRHPKITQAIKDQLDRIAHSSFLGLSNAPAIELAEKLVRLAQKISDGTMRPVGAVFNRDTPSSEIPVGAVSPPRPGARQLARVFYSDDGSTAMEVAIKMALQYWQHRKQGRPRFGRGERTKFVAFADAYHGDTLGAVSIGGIELFHSAFKPLLFDVLRVGQLSELEKIMEQHHDRIAAVVIEPLIQGAAGMRLWPRGLLAELRQLCDQYNVLLIADEVLTGFGRTGTMFACEQESVVPDLMALSKGLTGGYLPLAATLTTEEIFNAFLGEYSEFKTFFHGHSYTGNQLGCAAALANLRVFEEEQVLKNLESRIANLKSGLDRLRPLPHVIDVRQCGFIGAVEVGPFPIEQKMGIKVCVEMRKRGVLTRPIGNTIVIMPPYCVSDEQLERMLDVLRDAISATSTGVRIAG